MQTMWLGNVLIFLVHLSVLPATSWAKSVRGVHAHQHAHHEVSARRLSQPEDEDPTAEADRLAAQINADSASASDAAATAKQAAVVANNVAEHSIKITNHAKSALKNARQALHDARVESQGLDDGQKDSLKKAEAKLREATKTAEYGKLKKVEGAEELEKQKMQSDLEKTSKKKTELEQMRSDVKELRKKLKEKGGDEKADQDLKELDEELAKMEENGDASSQDNDEMKAEIERLRTQIDDMEEGEVDYDVSKKGKPHHNLPPEEEKELMKDVKMKEIDAGESGSVKEMKYEATPVQEKGIDIDTAMPYGDLEPFGREDTAQELTEESIKASDEMVDQIERAEVAEEKRAVFRAETRLRGAAVTSFDGVARSQTGNIDEYNHVHKWRNVHPLHHLADEESDITKWAFPDNADF